MSVTIQLPAGTAKPTGIVSHGARQIVCYPDLRPIVLMRGPSGAMVAYNAGIKPPTTAPAVNPGAASTALPATGTFRAGYCFGSSWRGIPSEMSPLVTGTLSGTKLVFSAFENPRDSYLTQAIDRILVAIQFEILDAVAGGITPGLFSIPQVLEVSVAAGAFTSATLTVDISQLDLARSGYNLGLASTLASIPPSVGQVDRQGERLWFGGQRRHVAMTAALTISNVTWRGRDVSKLVLASGDTFNDSHLYMQMLVAGLPLAHLWDVNSATEAYLDRRVTAGSAASFELDGVDNRIWPSAWHGYAPGRTVQAWPECVSLRHSITLPALTDGRRRIRSIVASGSAPEALTVMTDDGAFALTGGTAPVGTAGPDSERASLTPIAGAPGAAGDRGGEAIGGGSAWISYRGPVIAAGGGVQVLADSNQCRRMFKGEEWISTASLGDAVLCAAQDFEGLLIANVMINSVPNCWILFTRQPQAGFWVMTGGVITSNLLRYPDMQGRDVILAGDALGRVRRLLTPGTLRDLDSASAAAAYDCEIQGGWEGSKNRRFVVARGLMLDSLVIPTPATAKISVRSFRHHFAVRNMADVPAAQIADGTPITQDALLKDISITLGSWRHHSLRLKWSSIDGASSDLARPMEVTRWSLLFEDGQGPSSR